MPQRLAERAPPPGATPGHQESGTKWQVSRADSSIRTPVYAGSEAKSVSVLRSDSGIVQALESSVASGQGVHRTSIDKPRAPAQLPHVSFPYHCAPCFRLSFAVAGGVLTHVSTAESVMIRKNSEIAQSNGAGCYHLTIDPAGACLVPRAWERVLSSAYCAGRWCCIMIRGSPNGEAHMAVVDPFTPLRDWRASLYRGGSAVIDRFLDAIDTAILPGWVRDREYERTRSRADCIRCYRFDRPGDAAVRVGLQRVTATRVRGGPVQVLNHPPSGDAGRIRGWSPSSTAAACCPPRVRPVLAARGQRLDRGRRHTRRRNAVQPVRGHGRRGVATHGPGTRVVGKARLRLPGRAGRHRPDRAGPVARRQRVGARGRNSTHRSVLRGVRMAGQTAGRHGPMITLGQAVTDLIAAPRPILFLDTCTLPDIVRAPLPPDRCGPSGRRAPDAGCGRDGSALRSRASRGQTYFQVSLKYV